MIHFYVLFARKIVKKIKQKFQKSSIGNQSQHQKYKK